MTDTGAITAHRLRFSTPADTHIVWPAAFGRRFIVGVDTEEEFDWTQPFSRSARGVTAIAALPALHARFAAHGVSPVYLVDHPVAVDPHAAAILRTLVADGRSEIGAQLHSWVNPPHDEVSSPAASFAGNLPRALEAAKLDRLVVALERAFGTPPRIYRAGRYGLGPNTVALLAERGFRVDASMRGGFDYRAGGGADFTRVGTVAFRLPGGLIELPPTTLYTGRLRGVGRALHRAAGAVPRGRGALARLGLLSRVPLTPEGTPLEEAVAAIGLAARRGERLLNLSFHSPSLAPGNTPYVRDGADLARFHDWWDGVFAALDRAGYTPATLDEVIRAADG